MKMAQCSSSGKSVDSWHPRQRRLSRFTRSLRPRVSWTDQRWRCSASTRSRSSRSYEDSRPSDPCVTRPEVRGCSAAAHPCRSALSFGRGRRDCGRVVRQYAELREQGGKSDVAVELLDLAVAQVPEVGGREVDLGPRRLDHAGGRLEWPEEGALDRQLDADDVAVHGDLLQFPVNVGKELGQKGDQTAQLRTTQARLALHTADAVEYTVLCEQIPEPLGVQGITLPIVVRAQDDREVGLLTLGQVAVGERQLGQVARAQACADLRALDERRSLRRRGADSKSQARGRGQGGDRLPAMNLHVHVLLWFSESDATGLSPGVVNCRRAHTRSRRSGCRAWPTSAGSRRRASRTARGRCP